MPIADDYPVVEKSKIFHNQIEPRSPRSTRMSFQKAKAKWAVVSGVSAVKKIEHHTT